MTWISLLFLVVAIVGSAVVLVLRGLAAWRTLRSFSETTSTALTALERSAAVVEARAASVSEGTERLQDSISRLEQSLAQLAVLRAAAGDVGSTVGGVRGAVPRK